MRQRATHGGAPTKCKKNTHSQRHHVSDASAVFRNTGKGKMDGGKMGLMFLLSHLLSHDFLPVMKPEILWGSWPSVSTAISS